MHVDVWLAGNVPLGIFMMLVSLAFVRANRIFVRDVLQDPDAGWRIVPQIAAALVAAFLVWATFVDNWRQLVDLPYRLSQEFPSKRFEFDPTPDGLRTVTFALGILSLVPVAALFARHIGGYIVQAVVLIGALIFWAPLFAIRHRLDVNLALGFGGDVTSPVDIFAYGFFLLLDWLAVGLIVTASYLIFLMIVALPATFVLDVTRHRLPSTTDEANDFFADLGRRAALEGAKR
ncbi:MAG: hypothetical protein M3440_07470 [Chloroflexota bacterium]|nr:hypothetical protein [Chloroflexota bacterium]